MQLFPIRRCVGGILLAGMCALWPSIASAAGIDFHVKDATVHEAVLQLQQQQEYSIVVESDKVDMNRVVNVSLKDASIEDVLKSIFAGQNVSYTVEGKRIVVSNSKSKTQQKEQAAQETQKEEALV